MCERSGTWGLCSDHVERETARLWCSVELRDDWLDRCGALWEVRQVAELAVPALACHVRWRDKVAPRDFHG